MIADVLRCTPELHHPHVLDCVATDWGSFSFLLWGLTLAIIVALLLWRK